MQSIMQILIFALFSLNKFIFSGMEMTLPQSEKPFISQVVLQSCLMLDLTGLVSCYTVAMQYAFSVSRQFQALPAIILGIKHKVVGSQTITLCKQGENSASCSQAHGLQSGDACRFCRQSDYSWACGLPEAGNDRSHAQELSHGLQTVRHSLLKWRQSYYGLHFVICSDIARTRGWGDQARRGCGEWLGNSPW